MTCVWNGNLHRWRVNRSNKYHWKQFLNLDHWMQNPKPRKCNEYTWFVVRLRTGPATEPLKKLSNLKVKDKSHFDSVIQACALPDWHSRNKSLLPLKNCMHWRHMLLHQRTCAKGLDQPAQIHEAQIRTLFIPTLSDPCIYQQTINLESFNDHIHLSSTSPS